jgi:hypothetical protein
MSPANSDRVRASGLLNITPTLTAQQFTSVSVFRSKGIAEMTPTCRDRDSRQVGEV